MDLSSREGHGVAIVSLFFVFLCTNASAVVLLLLLPLGSQPWSWRTPCLVHFRKGCYYLLPCCYLWLTV